MGKMTTYLIVMIAIMLFCYFFGLLENTPNSTLLDMALNPDKETNPLLKNITLVFSIGVVTIAIGLAIVQKSDLALILLVAGVLVDLGWDFIAIGAKLASVSPEISVLIMSPIMIVYFVTVIEWWRGVDT